MWDREFHPKGFDLNPKSRENTFKQKRNGILSLSAVDFPLKIPGFDLWPISTVDLVAGGLEMST